MNEPFFAPEPIVEDSVDTSSLTYSLVPTTDHIVIEFNGEIVADTTHAIVVFENGERPVYYIPPEDVSVAALTPNKRTSVCAWKGVAQYYNLEVGNCISPTAAWCYPEPQAAAVEIRHYVAFYPHRIDRCIVNGLVVVGTPVEP